MKHKTIITDLIGGQVNYPLRKDMHLIKMVMVNGFKLKRGKDYSIELVFKEPHKKDSIFEGNNSPDGLKIFLKK